MARVLKRFNSVVDSHLTSWNPNRCCIHSAAASAKFHNRAGNRSGDPRRIPNGKVWKLDHPFVGTLLPWLRVYNYKAPGLMMVQYHTRRNMSILTDLLRRKKKSRDDDDEEYEVADAKTVALFEEPPKVLTEEEIQAKRNISRLNPCDQRLIHGQVPYSEPLNWVHHTVRYKQKLYARYGESSGVNPGLIWPTRKELKEKMEYESICHPFTIQEMVQKIQATRAREKADFERRAKEVEANMALVDKYKEDLKKRAETKERESSEAKARREKLVEEVRRHFGYTVDPREDRFQELLAKKEKEQRKSMKEARKLEKQQKMLDRIEGKSVSEKEKPKKAEKEEDE